MQTKLLYKLNTLTVAGVGVWISICSTSACGQDVFVTKSGSFAPPIPEGSVDGAFRLIETAACAAAEYDGIVVVEPGTYRETFSIDGPVTLTAPDGPFTVGDLSNAGETTLTVVTYNAHLFGPEDVYTLFWRSLLGQFADLVLDLTGFDEWIDDRIDALGHWQDASRAEAIVDAILEDDPDVVLLQEVWDESLKDILVDGFNAEGYHDWFYGDKRDRFLGIPDPMNSGLLVVSRHTLEVPEQTIYNDEEGLEECRRSIKDLLTGCWGSCFPPSAECRDCLTDAVNNIESDCILSDAFSSKGFIKMRIRKNDFPILIYNTHSQASGLTPGRPEQIEQLAEDIGLFRAVNPGAAIVIGGDFNERGEVLVTKEPTDNYLETLGPLGAIGGVHDAARNAPMPCFVVDSSPTATVDPTRNTLDEYFWPGSASNEEKIVRLDYFFTDGSPNGNVELLPVFTEVKEYQAPGLITGDGSEGYHEDSNLSDHFGVKAEFRLYRIPE